MTEADAGKQQEPSRTPEPPDQAWESGPASDGSSLAQPYSVESTAQSGRVNTHTEVSEPFLASGPMVGNTPLGATDASGMDLSQVGEDWKVFDNDQNEIGKVGEATSRYLHLKEGLLFKRDRYIPNRLVASVDADNDRVFLTQTKETIDGMDLSAPPSPSSAEDRADQSTAAERAIDQDQQAGATYVMDSTSRDERDGPSHQPGAEPGYRPMRNQPTDYAPFRSDAERNETDLDLRKNVAQGGDPFGGSQEATVGRPIPPGAPQAAERELPSEDVGRGG
ncbi:MAG: hypothetical protein ACR2HB_05600 [Dehalococcoidia bacterium]